MSDRHLDFTAKTDRELLLLVATKSNEAVDHLVLINSSLAEHEKRIGRLEAKEVKRDAEKTKPTKAKLAINWQVVAWFGSVAALIIIAVGTKIGLW